MIASSLTATAVEEIETKLKEILNNVEKSVDTESVVMWKASVPLRKKGFPKKAQIVPVAIHLYKKHDRVRIQVLTHDVSQAGAEALEDHISEALGTKIISRQYLDQMITVSPDREINRNKNVSPKSRRKGRQKRSAE
jgi:S-adenosylmethionine/arginine decarboxylase-like enzyme